MLYLKLIVKYFVKTLSCNIITICCVFNSNVSTSNLINSATTTSDQNSRSTSPSIEVIKKKSSLKSNKSNKSEKVKFYTPYTEKSEIESLLPSYSN